ncbi:flagellar hook-associated protein FlgK [Candidatus Formimonas warabiya]|uniref:Flagellar hook-associated protein 1 n=1 Tax=Formimonas warabiya TaxID=1761012 RepID=A0A3G1KTH3_FORW1|nr:flagellar hook-associated protein FlgK [Candidatus Formimonas warabiya]ATW25694.1 flagellar hook-associated protein FlgK [Candidatus Formimonas warabiya]
MSLFSILSTSVSGLKASQTALSVIGNNVANVNTEGYSRQRVDLSASASYEAAYFNGRLGSGVTIEGVSRVSNRYLEGRIQREQANADSWSTQLELLDKIELGLNSLDLSSRLGDFWDAWHNLSINPTMESPAYEIKERADALIGALQSAGQLLTDAENEINETITDQITQANSLGEQIAKLNAEISSSIKKGQEPNTFLDQRDVLLRELVGITGAAVTYNQDNTVSVTLDITDSSGTSQQLSLIDGSNVTAIPDGAAVDSTSGSLYGLQKVRDNELQDYKKDLDDLAKSLVEKVNDLHNPTDTGINFFKEPVTGVADLALSDEVKADYNNIGANTTSVEEKATLATNIYNLGTAFAKDVSSFFERVGTAVKVAETQNSYEEDMMSELENLRADVSGVSLDEETAYMIMYQRSYESSAKLLAVIDEMLETIINMV